MNIPDEERLQILYKRGMYHESIHMAMGTTDERKCDVFALLKIMKEHPKYAEAIFDVYNIQRSKMGYTVNTMRKKSGVQKQRTIKNGAMTYLMPNTYKKLKKYALNPQLIPQTDSEILKLTCEMTSEPEFSKEQLSAYTELMLQEHITSQDLANNEIVQACMKQGGFNHIDEYIASDKTLNKIMSQENIANKLLKVKEKLHSCDTNLETCRTIAELKGMPSLGKSSHISQTATINSNALKVRNKQHSM